jgi:hypothetical protein
MGVVIELKLFYECCDWIETILMSVVIELKLFYECYDWIEIILMSVVFEWGFEIADGKFCELLCTGYFKSLCQYRTTFRGRSPSEMAYECGPNFHC